MERTLYSVLLNTRETIARLRQSGHAIPPDIDGKLIRLEAAVDHALASSPDGSTIALAEEHVALNALCDLHLALQDRPEPLKKELRSVIDDWIAYAASTDVTPQELTRKCQERVSEIETWLRAAE